MVFFSSFLSIGNEETSITLIFTISLDSNILSCSRHGLVQLFPKSYFQNFLLSILSMSIPIRPRKERAYSFLIGSNFNVWNWKLVKSFREKFMRCKEIRGRNILCPQYGSSSVFLNPLVGKIVSLWLYLRRGIVSYFFVLGRVLRHFCSVLL